MHLDRKCLNNNAIAFSFDYHVGFFLLLLFLTICVIARQIEEHFENAPNIDFILYQHAILCGEGILCYLNPPNPFLLNKILLNLE